MIELTQDNHSEISDLLVGRRIVAAEKGRVEIPWADDEKDEWSIVPHADGVLTLDDGTRIFVRGHEGGCSCSAGCYYLTHLAAADNVITWVFFDDQPGGDEYDGGHSDGWYKIFVITENGALNIASFEGTDGNGYYGTGYELYVQLPEATQ